MSKISFIVPIYNAEAYLPQCVDSLLAQTHQDFEIILVDDESPDNCPEICDTYAEKDTRVKVIHQKNGGVCEARNAGIRCATGDWIYFVDSDDWLENNAGELMLKTAQETGADCVMIAHNEHKNGVMRSCQLFSKPLTLDKPEEIIELQKYTIYPSVSRLPYTGTRSGYAALWSKFVKAGIIQENGVFFNSNTKGLFEDGLFSLQVLDHVTKMVYIQTPLYNYRIQEASLIHGYRKNGDDLLKSSFQELENYLRTTKKWDAFAQAYYIRAVAFFAGFLSRYLFHPDNESKTGFKEMKKLLKSEPFCTSFQKVNRNLLESKHKIVYYCVKCRLYICLKLYAWLSLHWKKMK